jgi:hypothetical protein
MRRRSRGMALEPRKKQGLTTEKVSRMLGISRFTVAGYFDQGILTGWKNLITGKIVIDPKSVKAFVAFTRQWASTVRQAVDAFSGKRHKKEG